MNQEGKVSYVEITCKMCGKKELRYPGTKYCLACKNIRDYDNMKKHMAKKKEAQNENH